MADPTLTLIDSFNRTAEDPLSDSGKWTNHVLSGETYNLLTDGTVCVENSSSLSSDFSSAYRNDITPSNAIGAFTTVSAIPDSTSGFIVALFYLQGSFPDPNGYGVGVRIRNHAPTADTMRIIRLDAGVMTYIATLSQTIATGDIIGGIKDPATNIISFYYKPVAGSWSIPFTFTDTTYTGGGRVGLYLQGISPVPSVTDFYTGTIVSGLAVDSSMSPRRGAFVTVPVKISSNSRLVPVVPADRVWRDFPRQGLPAQVALRTVRPSRNLPAFVPDVTVPVNMLALRGKPVTILRVDPSEAIFPIFLWPAPPAPIPFEIIQRSLRQNAIISAQPQSASRLTTDDSFIALPPAPEIDIYFTTALRETPKEPVSFSRIFGDVLPIATVTPPAPEIEISIVSALRTERQEPFPTSRLFGDVLPVTIPTPPAPEYEIFVISALREIRPEPVRVSQIITDFIPVVLPIPPSLEKYLLLLQKPLREKHRSGGVQPLYPLVSGRSQSIIWLFPAPPVFDCAQGIGIVPVYYTTEGPNVVPVQTLTPAGLPWGFANWCDIVPICIQAPGPNVVPVYEAPDTKNNRVKVRLARPF